MLDKFFDRYTVSMSKVLLGNNLWFSKSIESKTIKEHLDSINTSIPDFSAEDYYEVSQESAVGNLDPAFHVAKWIGIEYPTIIYHHGNNETPFNYGVGSKNTFNSVLYKNRDEIQANLISLRAPFHNSGLKQYMHKISELDNFTALLAGSVDLIEKLIQILRNRGCDKIICTGISLGGWVTNLHRAYFNTADLYIPICAGASLDDVFLDSVYRKITAEEALRNPDILREVLNFEQQFLQVPDHNVHPLLARLDQIIRYDVQRKSYPNNPVATLEKGHVTSVLAPVLIRKHILAHI